MDRWWYVLQNILMGMVIIILSVLTYSFITEKHEWHRFTLQDWMDLYDYVNWWPEPTFVNRYYEDSKNYK